MTENRELKWKLLGDVCYSESLPVPLYYITLVKYTPFRGHLSFLQCCTGMTILLLVQEVVCAEQYGLLGGCCCQAKSACSQNMGHEVALLVVLYFGPFFKALCRMVESATWNHKKNLAQEQYKNVSFSSEKIWYKRKCVKEVITMAGGATWAGSVRSYYYVVVDPDEHEPAV